MAPLRSAEDPSLRKATILVVDDEELYRSAIERVLRRVGHQVLTARDATEALKIASSAKLHLVLADVLMPGINGIELVRQIREQHPDLPCIVMTGRGSPEKSVEALRAGAYWYLEKPFEEGNLEVVRRLIDNAVEQGRLRTENEDLHARLRQRYHPENIVDNSASLRTVMELARKVASSDSTVLLTGESGSGKELIARAIHYYSGRSKERFVAVHCGAIPEELLESELFGHVRGAFTHAVSHREGRFAWADGGTLFLDEIGEMSPTLQVKLLRVLQDHTFEPVGSSQTRSVNVRVIAATNQDLEAAVREKRFREDLFYRLNVIPIEVPPLRHRRDDIPHLAQHFYDRASSARGESAEGISPEAMDLLCGYAWPGNVRELENLMERLVVLVGQRRIEPHDLLPALRAPAGPSQEPAQLPAAGISFKDAVDALETRLITQALEQTGGNKNQAAKLLGLNRTTLLEKIKKKGLD